MAIAGDTIEEKVLNWPAAKRIKLDPMKPRAALLAAAILVACVLSGTNGRAQASTNAVTYLLIQGSTLGYSTNASVTNPPASVLHGTFQLTYYRGPLDFDSYTVSQLRLSADELPGGSVSIDGAGLYRVGSRLGVNQQMTLQARINGSPADLDSGPVALGSDPALIDIVVNGSAPTGAGSTNYYALHLVAAPVLSRWHYRLLGPSTLLDDCPPCDRLSRPLPLRGGFDLVQFYEDPFDTRYALTEIDCSVVSGAQLLYRVTGDGTLSVHHHLASAQTMTLQTTVAQGTDQVTRSFTNDSFQVNRPWALLESDLTDTAGNFAQVFHLHFLATPLWEVWFSPSQELTTGSLGGSNQTTRLGPGDLLADQGRLVKAKTEAVQLLGFGSGPGSFAITAMTVAPTGAIAFCTDTNLASTSLGSVQRGDLVSDRGAMVKSRQDLMGAFGLMPPLPEFGVDGVQVLDNGEVLFSITTDVFSEAKGAMLFRGDLLSSTGGVTRNHQDLLAQFHVSDTNHDYGLRAFYVWPQGEVWFSTEEDFTDANFGPVFGGDLLSDQGYIVFRNQELVSAFAPRETLTNFGLAALFVVTDATQPASAPHLLTPTIDLPSGAVSLGWAGQGYVFQVQRTLDLADPFMPVSPITSASAWTDLDPRRDDSQAVYRLRQW